MHPVAPIVLRIGRHIYALFLEVGIPQILVYREPILQADEAKHGGGIEVVRDNLLAEPARRVFRRVSIVLQYIIIIRLGALRILLPP